jgi:hypothetical protein
MGRTQSSGISVSLGSSGPAQPHALLGRVRDLRNRHDDVAWRQRAAANDQRDDAAVERAQYDLVQATERSIDRLHWRADLELQAWIWHVCSFVHHYAATVLADSAVRNVNAPRASTSTTTVSPSRISPWRISRASGFWMRCWITRLSGRAP